jgi:hypothetical protein
VIIGSKVAMHSFNLKVGKESSSQDFKGDFCIILRISAIDVGRKFVNWFKFYGIAVYYCNTAAFPFIPRYVLYIPLVSSGKNLTIVSLICRSVKNKAVSLCDFILSNQMDLFAITETWLEDGLKMKTGTGLNILRY